MNAVVLQTEHLSRTVNGTTIVDNITVSVQRGEVVAIVGPSGSGKSSFLRLLNRLDEPTAGRVLLDGQDYTTIPPHELRQQVGMVLQQPHLTAGTVAEQLRFGPRQRNDVLPEATIDDLLEQVGLAGYANRSTANLSGGEAQRVSLVRTLANSPRVLLLDEATSALDDASEQRIEMLIRSLVQQHGLACLMVTHDVAQAARLASRVMVIESGRLVRSGPADEVLHADEPV